ncbi:MAG: hypothetical protein AABM43_12435 [Actinomycetota bacterium]
MGWLRSHQLLFGTIVVGVVARVVFWAATDRRFEDALITIKHAKNAVNGHGLVHHLGEDRVQGFTSALSVLVPIPGELIAADGGLVAMRLASLVAFAVAAVYAYRIAQELQLTTWPTAFVLAYLALDQNQIFYGMAGMETQIAVAVLLAGIYYMLNEDFARTGISLGLALLARPDFVLWVVPAYVFLLLRNPRNAVGAGSISAAIVAPWVLFTTAYYGSPVPHTIEAKSLVFSPAMPTATDLSGWLTFAGDQLQFHRHDWSFLAPFLEKSLVVDTPLPYSLLKVFAFLVAGLAIIGACATWSRAAWRPAITFVLLYIAYVIAFQNLISYFLWYYQPVLAVVILLAAAGLDRLTAPRPKIAVVIAACGALLYSIQLPFTIPLDADVQHGIEDRVRMPLGQYLERAVRPGQTITSEPSGYVGYYTNGTLYDFPGLTSPTVADTLKKVSADYRNPWSIVYLMHPDWAVMRPGELDAMTQTYPRTAKHYVTVRQFQVPLSQPSLHWMGTRMSNIDREFSVLRRIPLRKSGGSRPSR